MRNDQNGDFPNFTRVRKGQQGAWSIPVFTGRAESLDFFQFARL